MPTPITAEELRAKEDKYLKVIGMEPSRIDEAVRASMPEIQELRGAYAIQPKAETNAPVDYEAKKAEQRAIVGEVQDVARKQDIQPTETPKQEAIKAEESRMVTTSAYDPLGYYTEAQPLEQTTSYRPAGAPNQDTIFGRQVSVSVGSVQDASMRAGKDSQLMADANQAAAQALDSYLLANDPTYREKTADERRHVLFSELQGLSYASSIKQGGVDNIAYEILQDVGAIKQGDMESARSAQNPLVPITAQGDVPDLSPAQMEYLKAYRAEATKRKAASLVGDGVPEADARAQATAFVNEQLGKPEWYQDPELKRQRLAEAPQFEGMLGIGVERYPSGATVESTPAYAMRLLMAPANMITGMVGGAIASSGIGTKDYRQQSEINPATKEEDPNLSTWEKSVRAGLDNVKRNRGATEEIYDLGIGLGVDSTWGKRALFGAALLTDVIAVPIIPGAGIAAGALEAGKITKAAKAAGTALKASDIVGLTARSIARENPVTNLLAKGIERYAPSVLEGYGDIRLYSSARLAEASNALVYAKQVAQTGDTTALFRGLENMLGAEHPITKAAKVQGAIIDSIEAFVPQALRTKLGEVSEAIALYDSRGVAGLLEAGSKIGIRDLSRWTQTAIAANPALRASVGSVKNADDLVRAVIDAGGLQMIRTAAVNEQAIKHVLEATKDFGAGSLYMLTSKTATGSKKLANEIIARALNSDVSKALAESNPVNVVKPVGSTGRLTADVINLTDESKSILKRFIELKLSGSSMKQPQLVQLLRKIEGGVISTEEARLIQDMNIDDIARSSKTVSAIPEQGLANLPKTVQDEIMKPFSMRSGFVLRTARDMYDKTFNKVDSKLLTPAISKGMNDIQRTCAAIPSTLILKIRELTSNIDVARAFGLTQLPNEQEAFLRIIFYPLEANAEKIAAHANQIADDISQLILRADLKTINLGEMVSPVKMTSSIELIPEEAARFAARTKQLEESLVKIISSNDLTGAVPAIRHYLIDIKEIVPEGALVLKPELVEQLLTGLYFEREAMAIFSQKMEPILAELVPRISEATLKNAGIDPRVGNLLIARRALYRIAETHLDRLEIPRPLDDVEDMLNHFRATISATDDSATNQVLRGSVNALINNYHAGNSAAVIALDAIDSAAESVIKRQRLLQFNADDAVKELTGMLKDPDKIAEAGYSPEARAIIEELRAKAYDTDKLKNYLATQDRAGPFTSALSGVFSAIKNIQYFFMLSVRPRFHGVNILTAPFIMAANIGGGDTVKSLWHLPEGMYLSARSTLAGRLGADIASKSMDVSIAFRNKAGKAYTWADLSSIARRGGISRADTIFISTKNGFDVGSEAISRNAEILRGWEASTKTSKVLQSARSFRDIFTDFASFSDMSYRSSVLIDSLKAGDDEATAVYKARNALYDYGKVTEAEQKYLQSWFAFYSFARASVVNAMENLLNNPSRVTNQIKASKGFRWDGDKENTSGRGSKQRSLFYEAEYMQGRPWIGYAKEDGVAKEAYAEYLPVLPLVDAYLLLAKVLGLLTRQSKELSIGDFAIERSSPWVQTFLGSRIEQTYGSGYIDPRHIAVMKRTGTYDLFKSMIGDPDLRDPVEGETAMEIDTNGKPAVPNFKDNKPARDRYIKLMQGVALLGASQAIVDWAPLIGVQPAASGIEMQTSFPETIGLTTDVRYTGPAERYQQKTGQKTQDDKQQAPEK